MDKAVDVVAERLNELGAPFLALRAGRLNYQRELSMQLQDLLANKVDLDEGAENSILCDVSDMENLLKAISDLEKKSEKIIKLEEEWTEVNGEINLQKFQYANPMFIKHVLKEDEINLVENSIKSLSENIEKSGFWSGLKNISAIGNLKKCLRTNSFDVNNENLSILRNELEFAKLVCKAR